MPLSTDNSFTIDEASDAFESLKYNPVTKKFEQINNIINIKDIPIVEENKNAADKN